MLAYLRHVEREYDVESDEERAANELALRARAK